MRIPIIIEPDYIESVWCRHAVNGIHYEARKKRYDVDLLDAKRVDETLPALRGGLVIVIGTSISWIPQLISKASEQNIHVILISYQPQQTHQNVSTVLMDYMVASRRCVSYLWAAGKRKIALYGVNINASNDLLKRDGCIAALQALSIKDMNSHIYQNTVSLEACYSSFQENRGNYDAVICTNDYAAASLILKLRQSGVKVPEDLYVVSFGNTLLSRYFRPGITSISLDNYELGRQSVLLYAYLERKPIQLSASIRIPCDLAIRESTNSFHPQENDDLPIHYHPTSELAFFQDQEVKETMRLETLLNLCDRSDLLILKNMRQGASYQAIADALDISENAIKYRIRRLLDGSGFSYRVDMLRTCDMYLENTDLIPEDTDV